MRLQLSNKSFLYDFYECSIPKAGFDNHASQYGCREVARFHVARNILSDDVPVTFQNLVLPWSKLKCSGLGSRVRSNGPLQGRAITVCLTHLLLEDLGETKLSLSARLQVPCRATCSNSKCFASAAPFSKRPRSCPLQAFGRAPTRRSKPTGAWGACVCCLW